MLPPSCSESAAEVVPMPGTLSAMILLVVRANDKAFSMAAMPVPVMPFPNLSW